MNLVQRPLIMPILVIIGKVRFLNLIWVILLGGYDCTSGGKSSIGYCYHHHHIYTSMHTYIQCIQDAQFTIITSGVTLGNL